MSEVIGLDVGESKTGIARASSVAKIAEPSMTVPTDQVVSTLKKMNEDQEIEAVVVGLPRNLNGDETKQTQWVRSWAKELKDQMPKLNLYWQDEALTTKQASTVIGKNITDDSAAASIILQDYLQTNQSDRVAI